MPLHRLARRREPVVDEAIHLPTAQHFFVQRSGILAGHANQAQQVAPTRRLLHQTIQPGARGRKLQHSLRRRGQVRHAGQRIADQQVALQAEGARRTIRHITQLFGDLQHLRPLLLPDAYRRDVIQHTGYRGDIQPGPTSNVFERDSFHETS